MFPGHSTQPDVAPHFRIIAKLEYDIEKKEWFTDYEG